MFLFYSCSRGFEAFKQGFQRVCGSTVLQLFHAQELQAMVSIHTLYTYVYSLVSFSETIWITPLTSWVA